MKFRTNINNRMSKKTLIIGASTKPERYSYKAAAKLLAHNHGIYLVGNRAGELFDHEITKDQNEYSDVDTVTMYVSAKNQLMKEPSNVILP